MKFDDIKVGNKVYDSWYPDWGIGEVVKLFKTTVHIEFGNRGKSIYDKAHVQFLGRSKDFYKRKLL